MDNEKGIKYSILRKIKAGDIQMKPKIHFILRSILFFAMTLFILAFTLYVVSFCIFIFRVNGIFLLPGFGFRGLGAALTSLPWLLVFLSIILVIILEILGKHFAFVYRRPLFYSALGIVLLLIMGSVLIGRMKLHDSIFRSAYNDGLPIAGPLYRRYGMMPLRNTCIGEVTKKDGDNLTIEERNGRIVHVEVKPETFFPFGSDIVPGDRILIIGDRDGDTIKAKAVRKVSDQDIPPFRQMRNRNYSAPPLPPGGPGRMLFP